jgi:type IV pilus assembly protein PilB
MGAARFGEILGRLVPISEQDISEILEEQAESHHRFGWIAMSWGLCQPEHVWQAWSEQLGQCRELVDLASVGIDTQSLVHVPFEVAQRFGVVPVRMTGNDLILAASLETIDQAVMQLPKLLGKRLKFVVADHNEVRSAIANSYLRVREAEKN